MEAENDEESENLSEDESEAIDSEEIELKR
jgi:hypothetical protein